MFARLVFVGFFIKVLLTGIVAKADLYEECVAGYDFGSFGADLIIVAPINIQCQEMCQKECNAFSRKISNIELNSAVITECIASCQNGRDFSSNFKDIDPSDAKKTIISSATVTVKCDASFANKNNGIYQSSQKVKADKDGKFRVKLSLAGDSGNSNKIYMCGKKAVEITPIFANDDENGGWYNTTTPQTYWPSKNSNYCLSSISNAEYNNLSNRSLWYPTTVYATSPQANDPYFPINKYSFCKWSAKNPNFTKTGIWIQDGDEMSITWKGNYSHAACNYSFGYCTRAQLAQCMTNKNLTNDQRNGCRNIWNNTSRLNVKSPSTSVFDVSATQTANLDGEAARIYPIGTYDPSKTNFNRETWFGLVGSVTDIGLDSVIDKNISGCNDDQTNFTKSECVVINNGGVQEYNYRGKLLNFSSSRTHFAIRHWDVYNPGRSDDLNYWDNNTGGVTVNISWAGCPYQNGELMQYLVAKDLSAAMSRPSSDWKDIPSTVFKDGADLEIPVSGEGGLFFRIKPISAPSGLPSNITSLYTEIGNRYGAYYLVVSPVLGSDTSNYDGIFKSIVKAVYQTLLGTEGKKGAVQLIYEGIVDNTVFKNVVFGLLTLYLIFFSLSFMIGNEELNQREGIIRILKIAIMVALTSPGSWQFFNDNFFRGLTEGSIDMINYIVSSSYGAEYFDFSSDIFNVFAVLDTPIERMWSPQVWKKIYSILLDSIFGILIVIIFLISIVTYTIAITKAVLVFIYCILGMSILMVTAPVFICCILFQRTREFFDTWWKHLILFFIQPQLVFASVMIFSLMLTITLQSALNFTVCPYCVLAIDLGSVYKACWIPGYQNITYSHLPANSSTFYIPMGLLSMSLIMLLLAQGMLGFISAISNIASRLITGTSIAGSMVDKAAGAGANAVYQNARSAVSNAVSAVEIAGYHTFKAAAESKVGKKVQRKLGVDLKFNPKGSSGRIGKAFESGVLGSVDTLSGINSDKGQQGQSSITELLNQRQQPPQK